MSRTAASALRQGLQAAALLKRRFAAELAAAAVMATLPFFPAPAHAAPAGEVAVICDREIPPYRVLLEGLKRACDCTVRVIPPQDAAQPGLEVRLKASGVRAVLAIGLEARAAVEAVRDLPVLLTMAPEVEPWVAAQANRSGLVMSLSPRQHLERLRQVFPRARRIGVVFDPVKTGDYVREAQGAAAALNLTLETRAIARPGELFRKLAELADRVDVLWVLPDPTVLQGENLKILLLTSFESHLPLYGFARKYVELGAVAASQFDFTALGRQVAEMIRRRLSETGDGVPPRWEYARDAQLVLNQKVAHKMGIVFDPDVLEAAADVLR